MTATEMALALGDAMMTGLSFLSDPTPALEHAPVQAGCVRRPRFPARGMPS
jgi:hypothetical protein